MAGYLFFLHLLVPGAVPRQLTTPSPSLLHHHLWNWMHNVSRGRCTNDSHVSRRPFAQRWKFAFNLCIVIIIRETLPELLEPCEVLHGWEVPINGMQSSVPHVSLHGKSFGCHWIFVSLTPEACCRLCMSLAGYLWDLLHGVLYLFLSGISQMCFSPHFAGLKKTKVQSLPGKGFPWAQLGTDAPWPTLAELTPC